MAESASAVDGNVADNVPVAMWEEDEGAVLSAVPDAAVGSVGSDGLVGMAPSRASSRIFLRYVLRFVHWTLLYSVCGDQLAFKYFLMKK
jgi:hypothetical protein